MSASVSRKPRILFLTPGLSSGGAEFWVVEMCRHLKRFEAAGVWPVSKTCKPEPIAELRELGVPIIVAGENLDCDLVVSWGVPDPRKRIGPTTLPLVTVCHGVWPEAPEGYFDDQAWQSTHVTAVSESAKEAYSPRYRQHATVLYNGVDPDRLAPKRPPDYYRNEWGIEEGRKLAVQVGRLEQEKRPDRLLDAAKHLSEGWDIAFVGDGSLRDLCVAEAEIVTKDSSRRVIFQSFVSDVGDIYDAADVVCVPSDHEGMPFVVLEAWLAGTPVVASDFAFAKEMRGVHGDVLEVVPRMGEPEDFANSIETAALDLPMIQRAKGVAEENYTVSHMAARWDDYLADVVFSGVLDTPSPDEVPEEVNRHLDCVNA